MRSLGLVETPGEQRQVGAGGGDVPELRGLSQFLREPGHCRDLGVDAPEVCEFHQRDQPVVAALNCSLSIVHSVGKAYDLVCEREPLFRIVGPENGGEAPVECVGERARVVQPSSHLNGFGAQRGACFGRWFVAQGTREAGEQAHAEGAVARRQAGERVAQEGDETKVVACPRPDDSPAVADGSLRKRFRHPAVGARSRTPRGRRSWLRACSRPSPRRRPRPARGRSASRCAS